MLYRRNRENAENLCREERTGFFNQEVYKTIAINGSIKGRISNFFSSITNIK